MVVAVEYAEIEESTADDCGYALRFPRFLGVRRTMGPTDADTIGRVESLYDRQ